MKQKYFFHINNYNEYHFAEYYLKEYFPATNEI